MGRTCTNMRVGASSGMPLAGSLSPAESGHSILYGYIRGRKGVAIRGRKGVARGSQGVAYPLAAIHHPDQLALYGRHRDFPHVLTLPLPVLSTVIRINVIPQCFHAARRS